MEDWKSWNLRTWNQRLLSHYFGSTDERARPVAVLLATADELARTTGDAGADADEVRDAFVEAVRQGIRFRGGLLEDATDYEGWPDPPRRVSPPRFVAHLLFTCIAASESSDELGDEGSFVLRLRALTQDQLPDHSLQWLPRLWEHLRDWLAANEGEYRPLLLPDPGSFTRIGYTIKLAFPDRRDQRQLSELLDRGGLAGHEPPVGRVLSLVGSQRGRFRRSFLLTFDEFRRLFEASTGHPERRLVEHRFWAAVREASLRGRGQAVLPDAALRLSLLGEEEDDRLALFAVSDHRTESADLESAELPVAYGVWRFALVPKSSETLDARALEQIAHAILDGSLRLPRLSSHVDQGLLPFVVGTHGLLELAGQDQLGEVSVALVRKANIDDLFRVFRRGAATTLPSSYDGWVQVHGLTLHTLPSETLEGTTLSRTWILHESLSPTSIRLRGGVRADDGWLGAHEVLPRVVAPGASAVVADGEAAHLELDKLGDDTWGFPRRDLTGEFAIIASFDSTEERRRIRFYAAPASEAFKPPADADAWIVEEVSGTGTLSSSIPFTPGPHDEDCTPLCERAAYLGPNVGQFVTRPEDAAWRISHFGGRFIGERAGVRGDAAVSSTWVASANARRRWRKMLFESTPSWSDSAFDEARRRAKARALADAHVRLDVQQLVPDLAPMRLPSPSDAVDRLVRIIAGRAAMRSGIDWREWGELAQRVLDIDAALRARVTRAWMEAGLIDIASYARWRHRALFARFPRIVAFRVGGHFGASLTGLTLTTAVDEMRRTASRIGMLVEERFSVSPLVPRTISVRAPDARALEELGRACRLPLHWLDLAHLRRGVSSRHEGTSAPPEHYEHTSRWSRWSLKNGDYPGVLVEHRMRSDRPDYWVVTSHEGSRIWSYDLNVARAWAAALLQQPAVTAAGDAFLEANHAFVPLPLARAATVLGSGLSGPTDIGTYRYPVGTMQLRDLVLDIMARTFNPPRLAVSVSEQATG